MAATSRLAWAAVARVSSSFSYSLTELLSSPTRPMSFSARFLVTGSPEGGERGHLAYEGAALLVHEVVQGVGYDLAVLLPIDERHGRRPRLLRRNPLPGEEAAVSATLATKESSCSTSRAWSRFRKYIPPEFRKGIARAQPSARVTTRLTASPSWRWRSKASWSLRSSSAWAFTESGGLPPRRDSTLRRPPGTPVRCVTAAGVVEGKGRGRINWGDSGRADAPEGRPARALIRVGGGGKGGLRALSRTPPRRARRWRGSSSRTRGERQRRSSRAAGGRP